MPNYKDWLKTFYTTDEDSRHNKEIVWGKVLDVTAKDDVIICIVYFSKNPLGSKIVAIPFDRIVQFVADGAIWATRKKKK